MSERLNTLINAGIKSGKKLLSIFITAGFPEIESTRDIILALDEAEVDFIELGIPFSDPIADGPVIQKSSDQAIDNGINLHKILEIVREIRKSSEIPILLMGYMNPITKFGLENFINQASNVSVDGLILPDWDLEENRNYHDDLKNHDLDLIHLIAPNTPANRIKLIDDVSTSFIYCVAYTGITGQNNKPTIETTNFLKTIRQELEHPLMIGFGINNHKDYNTYTNFADGVIIGSAFIKLLEKTPKSKRYEMIHTFIRDIRGTG